MAALLAAGDLVMVLRMTALREFVSPPEMKRGAGDGDLQRVEATDGDRFAMLKC